LTECRAGFIYRKGDISPLPISPERASRLRLEKIGFLIVFHDKMGQKEGHSPFQFDFGSIFLFPDGSQRIVIRSGQ